jgi:serine/threonine protein kinase
MIRLEKLHSAGYVHCDLKPDNILVGPHSDNSRIYLIDYGLAHSYIDTKGNHIEQPEYTSFKGSISYCSLNLFDK